MARSSAPPRRTAKQIARAREQRRAADDRLRQRLTMIRRMLRAGELSRVVVIRRMGGEERQVSEAISAGRRAGQIVARRAAGVVYLSLPERERLAVAPAPYARGYRRW